MEGRRIGFDSRNSRMKRWAVRATGSASMAAISVIVLSSMTAALVPHVSYKNATPILYNSTSQSGCAHAKSVHPSLSMTTGAGHANEFAHSATCFPIKGGYTVGSYGSAYAEVGAGMTMKLTKSYTNANSSWNISATAKAVATGTIKNCPTHYYNYSGLAYNGTGYSNYYFNESYQNCYAEASYNIYEYIEINDMTTSTFSFFSGPGIFLSAGQYVDNYSFSENYTSPGWTNYSYSCTTCYGSFGAGGTSTISTAPSLSATGVWSAGDTVSFQTFLEFDCYTSINYAKSASATCGLDAAAGVGHINLTQFQLS